MMLWKLLPAAAMLVTAVSIAAAHAPETGKNGGQQTDAGNYHVEAVANGNTLTLYVTDHSENPISTKGFRATAVLVVGGKPQRITLAPQGENRLIGTSPVTITAPIRGAIQLTGEDHVTVQAKF
jgi:hypothetical protein